MNQMNGGMGMNYGYGQQQMNGGMVYNQQYQQPLMTNALTPEQIKELRKNNNTAAIPQVTQVELYKAVCTHRDPQKNTFATVDNGDGTMTCQICGEVIRPVSYTKDQVDALTKDMIDVLQTTKLYYLDMSPNAVAEYFKIIPLLQRSPELYQQALNVFAKYDNGVMFNQQGGGNYFNMFAALTNPGMAMGGMAPQMMPQQQMYNQQQMAGMAPQMGMQQQMPMGGMAPQMGMPMQQNAFYAQPNMMQQQMCAAPQQGAPMQQPTTPQAAPQPTTGKAEVKAVINA